jgi:hypothetical protein
LSDDSALLTFLAAVAREIRLGYLAEDGIVAIGLAGNRVGKRPDPIGVVLSAANNKKQESINKTMWAATMAQLRDQIISPFGPHGAEPSHEALTILGIRFCCFSTAQQAQQ